MTIATLEGPMHAPSVDAEWARLVDELTRRDFLAGAAALAVLAACGNNGERGAGNAGAAGWTFTDDRGQRVSLSSPPQRIAAYIGTAAALWDFGVRPVAVFGPQRRADGSPEPAAGRVDLDAVESVGDTWDGVNLEALAAARPDLVVTGGISDEDLWVITADQLDEVEEIAPVVAVQAYDKSASEISDGYQRLAAALGADLDSPELQQARTDLDAASSAFSTAVASKPGLVAMATYADVDGLYVAKVDAFPDLLELRRLGLDLVDAGGSDDYWEMLSWEQAGRYDADLLLHDVRSYSLQPDELADYPTWNALPAVRAGQIGPWNAETVLSPQGLAAALAELTTTINAASADVV
jgi:iron complex transport system substrate-binding protein